MNEWDFRPPVCTNWARRGNKEQAVIMKIDHSPTNYNGTPLKKRLDFSIFGERCFDVDYLYFYYKINENHNSAGIPLRRQS